MENFEKDHDIKHDPLYGSRHLRGRIAEAVKHLRDEAEEVKRPQVKQFFMIPVTGSHQHDKYQENKTLYKFDPSA